MKLVEKDIKVSDILTKEALENAIVVHSAIGGSTNATLHLPAIARELGIYLEPELFDEINHRVPHLGNITPSGEHLTEAFWFAGGIPMVELELRDMLHLDVMTVTGKTLGENLEEIQKEGFFERNIGYLHNYGLHREQVIFPVEKAEEKVLWLFYGEIWRQTGQLSNILPARRKCGNAKDRQKCITARRKLIRPW